MRTALSILLLTFGCTSPIIGAECATGFAICAGSCVELNIDPNHCGACEFACEDGQTCNDGMCSGAVTDGGVNRDAGTTISFDAATVVDAGVADASVARDAAPRGADGGTPTDAGTPPVGCQVGELLCGRECVRPGIDSRHCGACDNACGDDEFCVAGSCTSECLAPRAICDSLCVHLFSDPDHCGSCGNACSSGVCSGGTCQSPLAGHLVLAGHDYRTSRPSMGLIAGNAVFLTRQNPTRVVVYEGDALPEAIVGTNGAIDRVAGIVGRSWERTVASGSEQVPLLLADADVFIIYAQTNADDAALFELSKVWGRALTGFLGQGGTVVVFDGAGTNSGTHRVLVHAGLMSVSSRVDISTRVLSVVSPGDAVALGLPLRYRAELSSVHFDSTEATVVVSDGVAPVVIHQVVLP